MFLPPLCQKYYVLRYGPLNLLCAISNFIHNAAPYKGTHRKMGVYAWKPIASYCSVALLMPRMNPSIFQDCLYLNGF
jgi:hypothetical protein